ncbi:DUF6603 domain-containing protein [Streptosporangium sp. NPDC049248]|uniref:DUF6603 domain-containing protein n=1 Tax=Streptosporangium sp. NPDC049248 TaxID=3155651 RepID=UPI00343D5CF9
MSLPERMSLVELINEFFGEPIELPAALVPILENVHQYQNLPAGERLVTARSPGYDDPAQGSPVDAVFIQTKRVGGSGAIGLLLDVQLRFDGSSLALVGEVVPKGAIVFPSLKILCLDRTLNVGEVNQLNGLLAGYGVAARFPVPNAMSADVWPKYFAAAITWQLGGGEMPALSIWLDKDKDKDDDDEAKEEEISFPGLPKSFGPLTIFGVKRGRDKAKDYLRVLLVAELKVGGQVLQLDGLGFMIPLTAKGFVPRPELIGAALSIRRDTPPLTINAALRYTGLGDDAISYGLAGLVRVETPALSVMGAGAWSRTADGHQMIFLYAEALLTSGASLFGPPPFTVTGLAAGFGVNSRMRPPEVAQLPSFPLLARLEEAPKVPGEPPPPPPEPLEVLNDLTSRTGWVRPEAGSYWIAAGLTFTSFRFIETRALAVIEFGNRLNVMLLGRTSITLPKNADASKKVHAQLNIDLRLAFLSEEHKLSLEAAVGPGSFVFTQSAELTGGLAFCVWTGGGRGGDFVITLGGYHPQFNAIKPAYYPNPARLGFRWLPCSRVVVQASGYTALTPGAIMFGAALAARYEKGVLSAWFTAHVDALIQWRPFYLDLALGISIGVAATIKVWFVKVRVSIEVGITLQFWTPPTGGRVSVKVWFIGFSFDFGAGRAGAPPVPWSEFQVQLPSPLRTTPVKGLQPDVDKDESEARTAREAPLLFSTDGFVFETEAVMPSSEISINGEVYATGPTVTIRPMRLTNVTSKHIVTLTRFENGAETEFDPGANDWLLEKIYRDVPRSMWGRVLDKPGDAATEPGLEPGRLSGVRFTVSPPELGAGVGPISSRVFKYEPLEDGDMPLRDGAVAGPAPRPDEASITTIARTLAAEATAQRRTAVHDALARLGAAPGKDTDGLLGHYAELVGRSMTSSPLITDAPASAR